jgi:hypothetical protein
MAHAAMLTNKRSLRFASLLALLLLLAVFAPRATASRPLRQPASAGPAAAVQTIALPAAAMSSEQQRQALPAEKLVGALLGMKPRGRAPPSGPSKRTNDIKS